VTAFGRTGFIPTDKMEKRRQREKERKRGNTNEKFTFIKSE